MNQLWAGAMVGLGGLIPELVLGLNGNHQKVVLLLKLKKYIVNGREYVTELSTIRR